MNLISTEHGQAFQKFYPEEVRPLSGSYLPDLMRGIIEKCSFLVVPSLEDATKEGAKFKNGRLIEEGHLIEIRELGVFSDGILAVCWNTDDAATVLRNIMSWAKESFGFRSPTTDFPIKFTSSVIVDFDVSIDAALVVIDEMRSQLMKSTKNLYGWSAQVETSRISIAADPTTMAPYTSVDFSIERRTGVPFSNNRYFSMATLDTGSHLSLLAAFEAKLL